MTKQHLIDTLAKGAGINKRMTKIAVDIIFRSMADTESYRTNKITR